MSKQPISCGLDFSVVPDLQTCITNSMQNNYTFVVIPIAHPRFRRNYVLGKSTVGGFTRCDMILSAQDWTTKIVAKVSSLDVDVPCAVSRQRCEDLINEELSYCRGLGVSAIIVDLHGRNSNNLARLVRSYFDNSHDHHSSSIWIRFPLVCEKTVFQSENYEDENWIETWDWWSQFHAQLEYDKRLGAVLELTPDLPHSNLLNLWLGEPVKAIILPMSIFESNKRGYPVLSRAHRDFVLQMISRDVQIIVSGALSCNPDYYTLYLNKMWEQRPRQKENDPMLTFALGWEDFIQTPLQPLADNLDTHTYNVFEKDPIKYEQYQKALVQALLDLKKEEPSYNCNGTKFYKSVIDIILKEEISNSQTNGKEENSTDNTEVSEEDNSNSALQSDHGDTNKSMDKKTFTIMILGAGRGPLVKAALNATDITGTQTKIIAVEKNPVAVVVLSALIREMWYDRDVQLVSGDMRHIQQSTHADIIVSELLGSWGDNELSPECLDGAAGLLRPGGVSIPCAYTSYVAPISSARLWAAAKSVASTTGFQNSDKNLETIWVVYMQNKFDIADVQPVFTFNHPAEGIKDSKGEVMRDSKGLPLTDNRRSATLTWDVKQGSVLHGFGGYFDCTLYGEHTLSIVPSTHTKGMISWFPVFIPIRTPLRVQKGDKITASFWRCVTERRVWYEWTVRVGVHTSGLHNCNGRSSEMLL